MKLEAKNLIPYLPYSLKVEMEGKKCNVAWMSTKNIAVIRPYGVGEYKKISWEYAHLNVKPFLRPMSELTENEAKDGHFMSGFSNYGALQILTGNPLLGHYGMIEYLLKNHYDIFGLIEKGLAIDINDVSLADA